MADHAAVLVLGMHRSGTSCLAGLLLAAGCRPPGPVVRNWDNRHGHHEATAAVRLSEAVLARVGGSWIAPPATCAWDAAQSAARDALLAPAPAAPLLKDPRMLLCLPFWLGGPHPLRRLGIVRHPLAVARSLLAWRRLPVEDGLRLWLAHNRALADLAERDGMPVLCFDHGRAAFLTAAADAIIGLGGDLDADPGRLAAAYVDDQVHHDGGDDAPAGTDRALLADCLDLHLRLAATPSPPAPRARFPWSAWEHLLEAIARRDAAAAAEALATALATARDPGAVLAPAVAELLRAGLTAVAQRAAATAIGIDASLRDLLIGKAALAAGDAATATAALTRATAAPQPYWEARSLRAHALRAGGQPAAARAALAALVDEAVHPHEVLATLAEWERADGLMTAIATMERAVATAPAHRRGRPAARLGEWLLADGDTDTATAVLRQAIADDPGYARAAAVLERCLSGPARDCAPRPRPGPSPTGP